MGSPLDLSSAAAAQEHLPGTYVSEQCMRVKKTLPSLCTVRLPNASARLSALTVGCDGTLYAADMLGTQLARIMPDGTLEAFAFTAPASGSR